MNSRKLIVSIVCSLAFALSSNFAIQPVFSQTFRVLPEQRSIHTRAPDQLPSFGLPPIETPFTIGADNDYREKVTLSLDEAIQTAIRNAEVIRVLAGVSASSSGRTIYDVAISNTAIDVQNAAFDPTFDITSTMNKTDRPGATFNPGDPSQAIFVGSSTDSINTTFGLSKRNFDGATVGLNVSAIGSYFEPGLVPLEPEYRSSAEITLRKPFLRGAGSRVNLAPVVVARIDTERSYFQFKDSVQELVRGVIAAYWNLVAARVDVWARQQQIEQATFALVRAEARQAQGLTAIADVAQARSALANFKATLISSRNNLIAAETALRNILGYQPSSSTVLVPTSTPLLEKVDFDWDEIISIAEQYRPDIIELKLILEADKHSLIQADNQAKPQFDGIANYRWDGLSGQMPNGTFLPNQPGRYAGFNLGVNFSVPLGLRQGRAGLRRQELLISRDRANLEQGIHSMIHQLTANYRNLDLNFEQYLAFKEAREQSRISFENQIAEFVADRREFINVLQAITDWGNAVSQEARSITQYNTELANVERQSGTILETHGIRFVEERYGSLGPQGLLGLRHSIECYPERMVIDGSDDRYNESSTTSDEVFNMEDLDYGRGTSRRTRGSERSSDELNGDSNEELLNPNQDSPGLSPPGLNTPRIDSPQSGDQSLNSARDIGTPAPRLGKRLINWIRRR